ncbi:hypothetical protein LC612_09245 [Nostoc sp. CHAB 5834]|nr:hypothetical protein [Nostoc sp. CHAB 5834]
MTDLQQEITTKLRRYQKDYQEYTTNTVIFKLKQQKSEIAGYLFNMLGNKVYYDVCGKNSEKQQSFDSQDFEKLISIVY